MPKLP